MCVGHRGCCYNGNSHCGSSPCGPSSWCSPGRCWNKLASVLAAAAPRMHAGAARCAPSSSMPAACCVANSSASFATSTVACFGSGTERGRTPRCRRGAAGERKHGVRIAWERCARQLRAALARRESPRAAPHGPCCPCMRARVDSAPVCHAHQPAEASPGRARTREARLLDLICACVGWGGVLQGPCRRA